MSQLTPKAAELLDAQVAFMIAQVSSDNLQPLIESNLKLLLANSKAIKLEEVITSDSIKKVAIKYASDMNLGPGVPELVGEVAQEMYSHDIFEKNTASDVMSQKDFKEILSKIAEMEDVRKRLISEAVANPMYASLMSDLLYHGIQDYITDNPLAKKIPGAQSMMKFGKNVMDKASPKLEETLKKYVASNIRSTLRESERFLNKNLTNEKIVELGMDAWINIKDRKLSGYKEYITANDIEEAYVMGFEYWKNLRTTNIYKHAIEEIVDFFFDKYKETSLFDLLSDISISEEMLLEDAMTFAPRAVNHLISTGVLAAFVHQYLMPFYLSEDVKRILGEE